MTTLICPKCGSTDDAGTKYCTNCGQPIQSSTIDSDILAPPRPNLFTNFPESANDEGTPNKKVIVAVVLAGIICAILDVRYSIDLVNDEVGRLQAIKAKERIRASESPSTSQQTRQIVAIGIEELTGEFVANAIAAETKYKGKRILVTGGRVFTIGRGWDSGGQKIQVRLETSGGGFANVINAFFPDSEQESVAKIGNGQRITLEGTLTSHFTSGQFAQLDFSDCKLVESVSTSHSSSKRDIPPIIKKAIGGSNLSDFEIGKIFTYKRFGHIYVWSFKPEFSYATSSAVINIIGEDLLQLEKLSAQVKGHMLVPEVFGADFVVVTNELNVAVGIMVWRPDPELNGLFRSIAVRLSDDLNGIPVRVDGYTSSDTTKGTYVGIAGLR